MYHCSSVMRRPSVHEKDAMSAKDARDEGRHVLEMMAAVSQNDDDDDDNNGSMTPDHLKVGQSMCLVTPNQQKYE